VRIGVLALQGDFEAHARLLRSLGEFLRDNTTLRRASTIQFLLGISYGGFWATVAPMMLALHGFGPARRVEIALLEGDREHFIELNAPRDKAFAIGQQVGLEPRAYRLFAASAG